MSLFLFIVASKYHFCVVLEWYLRACVRYCHILCSAVGQGLQVLLWRSSGGMNSDL